MKMKYLAILACTFAFYSLPASAEESKTMDAEGSSEVSISSNDVKKVINYIVDTALKYGEFSKVQEKACRKGSFWERTFSFRSFSGAFCSPSLGYDESIVAICGGWKDFDKSSCAKNIKIPLGEDGRKKAQANICKADASKLNTLGQKVQIYLKEHKMCSTEE